LLIFELFLNYLLKESILNHIQHNDIRRYEVRLFVMPIALLYPILPKHFTLHVKQF